VREAALDDPALLAQAGAVVGAATRDDGLDAARPEQAAILVVVAAAVGEDRVGFLSRSATLADHRACVQLVEQRQQLSDVVAVAACQ
jgi:hypothetical protein